MLNATEIQFSLIYVKNSRLVPQEVLGLTPVNQDIKSAKGVFLVAHDYSPGPKSFLRSFEE